MVGDSWRGRLVAGVLALSCVAVVGCADPVLTPGPVVGGTPTCDAFEATKVQGAVKPHIVRIVAGNGSGTGFILRTPKNEVLIATNHHVIAEGDKFSALFYGEGGTKTELGGLEVVKVDTKNDLALLKATRLGGMTEGLYLNPEGAKLGTRVAAMGYPYVAGSTDFALTFEPGDVSAEQREIKTENGTSRKFIQTNANINPGNSGGPVVDACGNVVGVVVATHIEAQRVGLVVPVQNLVELYKKYDEPAPKPEDGIKGNLADFEKAVKWRDSTAAGQLFARTYLETTVLEDFMNFVGRAEAQESQYRQILAQGGIDYDSAPYEQKAAFLRERLEPEEYLAWTIKNAVAAGAMGPYEAMQLYLSTWIVDVFGEVKGMKVIEVTNTTDKAGVARVEIENKNGVSLFEFGMAHEWGDWRIATVRCVRGC